MQIVNEVSSHRVLNQSGRNKELLPVDLTHESDLRVLIEAVESGENGETLEVTPTEYTQTDTSPALEHVRIAQSAVQSSRRELDELRGSPLSYDQLRDAMQRSVQVALDTASNSFGRVGDEVIAAIKAGGRGEAAGEAALVHVKTSMRALEYVTQHAGGRDPEEFLDDVEAVIEPLETAAFELLRA